MKKFCTVSLVLLGIAGFIYFQFGNNNHTTNCEAKNVSSSSFYEFNEEDVIFKGFVNGYQWDSYLTKHYGVEKILNKNKDKGEIYVFIYKKGNIAKMEIIVSSICWRNTRIWDYAYIIENTNMFGGNRREFNLDGNYFKQMRIEIDKVNDTAQFKILGKNDGLLVLDTKIIYNNGILFKM